MVNSYYFNHDALAKDGRASRFGSAVLALGLAGATATFAMDKHPEKAVAQAPSAAAPGVLPRLPNELQGVVFSHLDGRAHRNLLATDKAIRQTMLERFRLATSLDVEERDPRSLPRILQDYAGNTRLKAVSFQVGRRVSAADLDALALRFPALEELVFNVRYRHGDFHKRTRLDAAALTAIASFTQLKTLGLSRLKEADYLAASIPLAPLVALKQLLDLDLSCNRKVKDEHLVFLKHLAGLKRLNLSGTRCSGAFLEQMAPEASLETLDLGSCPLKPGVLGGLAGHPNLTFLGLGETPVKASDVPFIAALVHLRHLDLSGHRNSLSPEDILQLGSLRNLRRLDLIRNQFLGTHGLLTVAVAFPLLEDLNLRGMRKLNGEGGGVGPLHYLVRLKKLNLANTRLPAGSLGPLAGLERIEYLDVTNTILGAADIAVLREQRSLTTLILDSTSTTEADLEEFGALQSLERLSLEGVRISDRGVAAVAQLKGLTHLSLGPPLTGEKFGVSLDSLLSLPRLRHLDLKGLAISEETVAHFLEAFAARHQGRHIQVRHD